MFWGMTMKNINVDFIQNDYFEIAKKAKMLDCYRLLSKFQQKWQDIISEYNTVTNSTLKFQFLTDESSLFYFILNSEKKQGALYPLTLKGINDFKNQKGPLLKELATWDLKINELEEFVETQLTPALNYATPTDLVSILGLPELGLPDF